IWLKVSDAMSLPSDPRGRSIRSCMYSHCAMAYLLLSSASPTFAISRKVAQSVTSLLVPILWATAGIVKLLRLISPSDNRGRILASTLLLDSGVVAFEDDVY